MFFLIVPSSVVCDHQQLWKPNDRAGSHQSVSNQGINHPGAVHAQEQERTCQAGAPAGCSPHSEVFGVPIGIILRVKL
jgi:hypothetical protein